MMGSELMNANTIIGRHILAFPINCSQFEQYLIVPIPIKLTAHLRWPKLGSVGN